MPFYYLYKSVPIINIYKPPGPTSHDIVDKIRKITGERRVGHAGTLDPFAEGVLVIGVGRKSTKKLGEITKGTRKEYVATIELGKTSDTGDITGEIRNSKSDRARHRLWRSQRRAGTLNKSKIINSKLKTQFLKKVLKSFEGEIEQTPPIYSAIKIKGEPAYKKARRGEKVDMPLRTVQIYEIEPLKSADLYRSRRIYTDLKTGILVIRVVCSSGTYIRTLAEDIGKKLGTGAYVKKLIRTRVGKYKIENAVSLKKLKESLL